MNTAPSVVTSALLPLALAFIMFSLGLTLRAADFRAVLQRPRALTLGLVGQMLMLPMLGAMVASGAGLAPEMAVGLMVLCACPGGVSSGLLTHLGKGDVALSISLTAITSLAAMVSLPLVVDVAMRHFLSSGLQTELPLARMVRSMFLLTTLPVLLGMALRAWRPQAVDSHWAARASRLATGLFLMIVVATFWSQREVLSTHGPALGPACLALNAAALAGAWTLGTVGGLARRDRISVATECGLQNSALGIYVCVELLQAPEMSAPSVVYALLMNLGALLFVALLRKRPAPSQPGWPA